MSQSIDEWIDERSRGLLRWRYIALSGVGLVLCSLGAGKASGWLVWLAVAGMVLFALLTAAITWARDRLARREKLLAADAAADSKDLATRLMTTVSGGGLPIVTTLGEICSERRRDGYDPRTALVDRVLVAAQKWVGSETAANRAVFYRRLDLDTLICDMTWVGRDQPPRRAKWDRRDGALGRFMLEFLDGAGDPYQDYPDVKHHAPVGFGNPAEASYRSFLTARVTAGSERLGVLAVDSPGTANFTEKDKGILLLLAGMLGAGLAADSHLVREAAAEGNGPAVES